MAKKTAKSVAKTVKKPAVKAEEKVKEATKVEQPKVEKIAYSPIVVIDASKPKILDIEKMESNGGKLLLKCHGNASIQLGKGTDGNIIHCKDETHAVLEFSDNWQLMSICKI